MRGRQQVYPIFCRPIPRWFVGWKGRLKTVEMRPHQVGGGAPDAGPRVPGDGRRLPSVPASRLRCWLGWLGWRVFAEFAPSLAGGAWFGWGVIST